jgi:sec-independent protein translocase protein TatA
MFSGLENPTHILMLLLLVLLFFGAKRLPEMGRSLGTGMREFRDSVTGRTPDDSAVSGDVPVAVASTAEVDDSMSRAAKPS